MSDNPINDLMKSTMENLKDMIDVNTIVGDAIESKDGTLILPISRVSLGFASGGSEFNSKDCEKDLPFGGGSGAGVTLKPVAFLVIKRDSVRLLSLDQSNTYDKIVDSIPQIIDMLKKSNTKEYKSGNKEHNKTSKHEDTKKDE